MKKIKLIIIIVLVSVFAKAQNYKKDSVTWRTLEFRPTDTTRFLELTNLLDSFNTRDILIDTIAYKKDTIDVILTVIDTSGHWKVLEYVTLDRIVNGEYIYLVVKDSTYIQTEKGQLFWIRAKEVIEVWNKFIQYHVKYILPKEYQKCIVVNKIK